MKNYAERLVYAIKLRQTNQTKLAEAIGVKPQAIQYLCKKGTKSTYTNKICNALKIDPNWLSEGLGDINTLSYKNKSPADIKQQINEPGSDYDNKNSKDAGSTHSEDMQRWIATYDKLSSSERASVRAVCDAIIKPEEVDRNGNNKSNGTK